MPGAVERGCAVASRKRLAVRRRRGARRTARTRAARGTPRSATCGATSLVGLRSSSSARPGSRRRAPRRARAVSPSFSSRKLRPSSASTTPLTTPPKRVAIPPASTTCATRSGTRAPRGPRPRAALAAGRAGRRKRRQVGRRGWLDDARDDVRRGDSSPAATASRSRSNAAGVEPVSARASSRVPAIDLVEDHRDGSRARGSDAAYGARCTPASVTIAEISAAGVTSKAGLRAAKRARHLGSVALLDRDLGAGRRRRGRSSRSAPRPRAGCRDGRRAPRAPYVPILFAVSPFAAMRSAPVTTTSTSPARHQRRGRAVHDHRVRDPERLELPRGQPRALEQRARLVDPDVRDAAPLRTPRGSHRRRCRSRPSRARRRCSASARARPAGTSSAACAPICRQRSTSSSWMRSRALARRVVAHLVERPAEVDRRRPRRRERLVRGVEVLPALGCERQPVGGRDADRGRPAHGERPDRLGELAPPSPQRSSTSSSGSRRWSRTTTASSSSRTMRVRLENRGARGCSPRSRSPTCPSSHDARYFACSSVSWSIATPIVASLSRAISSSISFGTS